MAGKKNPGKGKAHAKNPGPGKENKKKEAAIGMDKKKAITEDTDLQDEQIVVMPDNLPATEAEGIKPGAPESEKDAELAISMDEEKAITEDTDLQDEQIVVMPDNLPATEAEEAKPGAPKSEKDAELAIGMDEEKAITDDTNLQGGQIMVMPDNLPAPEAKAGTEPPAAQASKTQEAAVSAKSARSAGKSGPRLPGGISRRPLMAGTNPYLPQLATVMEIIEETPNIRTLRVVPDSGMGGFIFEPGQVGQLSVFGAGEATFVINSPPSQKDYLQFSVMRAGEVTDAIHRLYTGDKIGLRAPLGNFFPYVEWKGKNVFFVGGGIGMAPLRTIMLHLLEHKQEYGKISLLYGARTPKDMAYSYELDAWKNDPDLDCTLCIDNPYEQWHHKVGLIPKVLEEINPSPLNTVAVLCGPPIMIKFTLQTLLKLGFEPQNIVTTLEKRMKCGIGICGRCNIGDRYVCVDGPVFTLAELDSLPPDL